MEKEELIPNVGNYRIVEDDSIFWIEQRVQDNKWVKTDKIGEPIEGGEPYTYDSLKSANYAMESFNFEKDFMRFIVNDYNK